LYLKGAKINKSDRAPKTAKANYRFGCFFLRCWVPHVELFVARVELFPPHVELLVAHVELFVAHVEL
jgi:hypothetical protein